MFANDRESLITAFEGKSFPDKDKSNLSWEIGGLRDLKDEGLYRPVQCSEIQWRIRVAKTTYSFNTEHLELRLVLLSSSKVAEIEILQIVVVLKTYFPVETIFLEIREHNIKVKNGQQILLLSRPTAGMNLDKVIISCNMDYTTNVISEASNNVKEIPATISADLKSSLKYNAFSDVKLISQDKEFQVHESLSAGSSVFSTMCQPDMEEHLMNEAIIDYEAPKVLEGMVNYIYTDKLTDVSGELLMLAEKYGSKALKAKFDHALVETLTIENAIEMLNLSNQYNAEYLKNRALKFIKKFGKDIVKTSAFENLEDSKAKIILELFLSD